MHVTTKQYVYVCTQHTQIGDKDCVELFNEIHDADALSLLDEASTITHQVANRLTIARMIHICLYMGICNVIWDGVWVCVIVWCVNALSILVYTVAISLSLFNQLSPLER